MMIMESTNERYSSSLAHSISAPSITSSYQMNAPLQTTLKRVSREIQLRKNGQRDSKQPLPPIYEMIGNSIAYQLLLQSHPEITVKLINSMYPTLKGLQPTVEWLYYDYLDAFNNSLRKKATPQCLHPSDIPTVKFLLDLCVHVASLPTNEDLRYISPMPSLWMHLLAIFSSSPQNQHTLVSHSCTSKVVGCMNLTSMADNNKLQCHGWEVLNNIINIPTNDGKKPAVHIQAITLLLSHIRRLFEQFNYDTNLISAILKFIATLATTVRSCIVTPQTNPDNPPPYTKSYSQDIFRLLEDSEVRQLIMDLPEHLQDDSQFKTLLQTVLLALAPIEYPQQQKTVVKPPPKPKRSKCRSQLFPDLQLVPTSEHGAVHTRRNRKLPDIPVKRLSHSKSTEDILDSDNPCVSYCDTELSLPVGIIRHASRKRSPTIQPSQEKVIGHISRMDSSTIQPSNEQIISRMESPTIQPSNAKVISRMESPTVQPSNEKAIDNPDLISYSKPHRPARSIANIISAKGPQQLTHYNRVSLKKHRQSYEKAVTSSQRKYSENTSGKGTPEIYQHLQNSNCDVTQALAERKEIVVSIVQLWKGEKALQAASNLVLSCFFNGGADTPLFIDCLDCFCSNPSYWSLGVCIILLPYFRQIITGEQDVRHVKILNNTINLIVKRFSVIILSIKKSKHTSRVHMEQRQACYHELHLLYTTVSRSHDRSHDRESQLAHDELDKLIKTLKPFSEPL